ncbi:hypothetical protein [Roseibium aggregatum]|uniref:Uncharacterized protein n=1 Tax=Roseibium aggregatum TaxID=187304 RepID=A0A926P186_9HYPH|nr:hypothetical protein [Roseibium aggregatum]MBD1547490.1 hypothetical protein [Roseibium aggregatum]
MLRKFVLAAAIGFSLLQPAFAGDLVNTASEAEAALDAGKSTEAVQLMREGLIEAWKAAPLSIDKALFVKERAAGFGLYEPRPDAVFAQGETILLYLEPIGFTWKQENDIYRSDIAVDFELLSPDGDILAGKRDFGEFKFASHAFNTEYMANMTVNLTGAPKAKYMLLITLRDQLNSDQSASVQLPFEIR